MTRAELLMLIKLQRFIMDTLYEYGKDTKELLPISQALDVLIVDYYKAPEQVFMLYVQQCSY